jgi:glyoxylase-like metal-dependent hydrolase (beta-lactamase superfamily II)
VTVFFHYSLYGCANVYLVGNDQTKEAIIVDPASFTVGLLKFIEDRGFDITSVLLTHNHQHHINGLRTLLKIYDATVYSSNTMIEAPSCQLIHDGEIFQAGGITVEALSVPGHSADSMAFRIGKLVFTGDCLHAGLIGKTLSQYGLSLLKEQLGLKILSLPDDCILLPGHGPPSSVGIEKLYNVGLQKTKAESRTDRYRFFV